MREKIPVYVYRNHEFIGKFASKQEAAYATSESASIVGHVTLGKQEMSKKGFVYTLEPLTDEEIQHMPTKRQKNEEPKAPRANNECKEIVNNYEYEVDCKDRKVCYLERSKEARKAQLRQFINVRCDWHWRTSPPQLVTLEKKFIDEILDSL